MAVSVEWRHSGGPRYEGETIWLKSSRDCPQCPQAGYSSRPQRSLYFMTHNLPFVQLSVDLGKVLDKQSNELIFGM